ncbi:hypothetical protein GRI38_08610 [Altererythrobacter aurantiacus]|uniref:Uncharacterized protein n=1 Tax=Parapontixanthobacter aurantiacus TaxID=1463599 RepID=A0A844ZGJ5_9SPHN|nr:hypothetical protein [Parapontixanthobacter aurantiacus]MXO86087.1 hypothetical protein [Parapontixanthobacter aurantiacus]
MTTEAPGRPGLFRRPSTWGASIFLAFGLILLLRITDAIDATTGFILMVAAMTLMFPLVKTALARQKAQGYLSPAITRYNRRFLLASFGYVLGLGLAVTINDRVALSDGETILIALLPIIPVFGMIWTMARYIVEEEDEYLRHRAIMASLTGLGLVLTFGTFWGFLETFEVVPHIWAWWVFPAWAIGMGISQCWLAFRDRTGGRS